MYVCIDHMYVCIYVSMYVFGVRTSSSSFYHIPRYGIIEAICMIVLYFIMICICVCVCVSVICLRYVCVSVVCLRDHFRQYGRMQALRVIILCYLYVFFMYAHIVILRIHTSSLYACTHRHYMYAHIIIVWLHTSSCMHTLLSLPSHTSI